MANKERPRIDRTNQRRRNPKTSRRRRKSQPNPSLAEAAAPDGGGARYFTVDAVAPEIDQLKPYLQSISDESKRQEAEIVLQRVRDRWNGAVEEKRQAGEDDVEKRIAAALSSSEDRYRTFVDHCADALFLQDWDGYVVDVNRQACVSLGYERDELIGMHPTQFDPDVGRELPAELSARLDAGETVGFDTRHRRKDGTLFPVEVRLRPFGAGAARFILSLAHDITKRKAAEEANARLASIVESTDDGIHATTLDGTVTSWNAAAQRLYGYTSEEMLGESTARLVPTERPDEATRLLHLVKEGRSTTHFETVRLRKDGSAVAVSLTISPIVGPNGEVVGASAIARDITRRKRAEETIRQIVEAITPKTGQDFFRALANHLSRACQLEYAVVAEVDPADSNLAHTTAVSLRGRTIDNFSYDLRGTPCENVMGRSFCHYPKDVQREFPDDLLLAEMGIDSYMGTPLFSSSGRPLGLIALMHNRPIAHPERAEAILQVVAARAGAELERKRTEADLNQTRFEFEFLATTFPALIFRSDAGGNGVAVNDERWMEMSGQEAGSWIGDGWSLAVHPEERARVVKCWKEAVARGAIWADEFRFRKPDESVTWVLSQAVPARDEHGNIVGYIGACIDITHLKQTEQALLRTQLSVDRAAIAIHWIGKDAEIRYVNDVACTQVGYSRAELHGMSILDLAIDHTPDTWRARFEEVRHLGCIRFESRHRRKDGSIFPIDVTVNYVQFDGEEFLFSFVQDITEQKRVADRLEQQNVELLHVTRLSTMGQMVATLSHELAQPLSALSNYADACAMQLADASDRDPVLANNIREIAKQVDRAGAILHRVREFVRHREPLRATCDLNSILQDSLALMEADNRRHQVAVRQELSSTKIPVDVDRIQIQQLVVNLLTNARDAMIGNESSDGVVTIRSRNDNNEGMIEVHDTGCGFPAEIKDRLFEPFVTSKSEGMGIGLSICQTIVHSHGGSIAAEPNVGRGVTFRVYLPINREDSHDC